MAHTTEVDNLSLGNLCYDVRSHSALNEFIVSPRVLFVKDIDTQACKQFVALIRHVSHYAILLNTDGTIYGHSDQFAQLARGNQNTILGQNFGDTLRADHTGVFADFLETCENATELDGLTCSVTLEDDDLLLDLTVTPLSLNDQFVGMLAQSAPNAANDLPKLNFLLENLDQGVWDYDIAANSFHVSPAWYRIRGMDPDTDLLTPDRDWLQSIHPEDRDRLYNHLYEQTCSAEGSMQIEYRHIHNDGHYIWIMCQAKVVETDLNGRPTRIVGTDTDITHARATSEQLDHLDQKLRLAVETAGIGVWEYNADTHTVHWDDRMLEIYGITDGQNHRAGDQWEKHLHPDDLEETLRYSQECQARGTDFQRDYRIVRPDGEVRYVRSRAGQFGELGETKVLIGVNIDVTEDYARAHELEQARAQLQHDSRHDALTGLGNRRLLDETTASLTAGKHADQTYAVLHLDLDHFKPVNDALGHAAGDAVLKTVANRLKGVVADQGEAFRIGGDEFAVVLPVAPSKEELDAFCGQIILQMNKPVTYEGQECRIGISIGCALGKGQLDSHAEVFIQADKALYAAKSAGRNCYRVHELSRQ